MNAFKARLLSMLILVSLLAAFPNSHARAYSVIYVDCDATGLNDGTSWKNAYTNLQSALAAEPPAVEIWVAEGVYRPSTFDRSISFYLKNGVAIYGGFAGNETLLTQRDPIANVTSLSGEIGRPSRLDNSYNVVVSVKTDATAILDGFTVADGYANDYSLATSYLGGGMYNLGSPTLRNITFETNYATLSGGGMYSLGKPTLRNVTFSLNSTDYFGGGIYNDSSSPTLKRVTFSKNSALRGGGMYNSSSDLTLVDVTFRNNFAEDGGGMYNDSGHSTLSGVEFIGNSATNVGGGMTNYNGSTPTLTDITFSINSAGYGGGMYNYFSSPTLTDVKFSGNSAARDGGGIYGYSSSPILTGVVFSENIAEQFGGGMLSLGDGNPTLTNVTFSGNIANDSGGGMLTGKAAATLTDVTFDNNSATYGGGMQNSGNSILTNVTFSGNTANEIGGGMINIGDATFTNVTFSGNSANAGGGGMQNIGNPILTNVTFSGNSAVNEGGGLRNDGQPILRNTILWGNTAPIGSQVFDNGGIGGGCNPVTIYNSVVQDDCPEGSICMDIITEDPLLGTLGDYGGSTQTIPLDLGSSAIDTGDDSVCPAADQRGVARPQGSRCDIGAYEAAPTVGPGTYDDTDPAWSYTGTWTTFNGAGPYNDTLHQSNVTGSSAEVIFNGGQIRLTYLQAPGRGLIDVYIDGTKVDTLDANNSTIVWQATWTSQMLPAGIHTVHFQNADGGWIDMDAITILP